MKFISPFQFVTFDRLKSNYSKELDEAQADLLAQFGNSESKKINIKGQLMSKNDVTELFNTFDNGTHIRYYSEIQKDIVLAVFLIEKRYNADMNFRPAGIFHEKGFIEFISPYFSDSYVSIFKQNFEEKNKLVIKSLMSMNAVLLNDHWRMKSKKLIEEVLNQQAEKLSVVIGDIENGVTYSQRQLLDVHHPDLMYCYNALPSNYENIKVDYAQKMIELATAVNPQDQEQAQYILSDAKLMDTTPNTELKIEKAKDRLGGNAVWHKNMNPVIYGIIGLVLFLMTGSYFYQKQRIHNVPNTVYQDIAPQEEKITRQNQSENEELAKNNGRDAEIITSKVATKAQKAEIVKIRANLKVNKAAFNDFVKAQKRNYNIEKEKTFFEQHIANYKYQLNNVAGLPFYEVRKEYIAFLQDCYVRYRRELNCKNDMVYFSDFLSSERTLLHF